MPSSLELESAHRVAYTSSSIPSFLPISKISALHGAQYAAQLSASGAGKGYGSTLVIGLEDLVEIARAALVAKAGSPPSYLPPMTCVSFGGGEGGTEAGASCLCTPDNGLLWVYKRLGCATPVELYELEEEPTLQHQQLVAACLNNLTASGLQYPGGQAHSASQPF